MDKCYYETLLEKTTIYRYLKEKCEKDCQHEVLALVSEVCVFAVMRLKIVIKNMPEFTLHDETHIFNMLTILGKIIPISTLEKLSIPDLLMLVLSVFLHDIGMAPEEKYILSWKGQLLDEEYDEELRKEKEVFSRFRMTYTHQLADIDRLLSQGDNGKA